MVMHAKNKSIKETACKLSISYCFWSVADTKNIKCTDILKKTHLYFVTTLSSKSGRFKRMKV